MTATVRRRAARGQGQLLREEIIATAERLLIERGSEEAVSIRAIAQAIGVSTPSIYLHFADKEELFVAVSEARFDQLTRLSNEAAAAASGPLDEIRRRGEAYIQFGLENPEQYRVLFLGKDAKAAAPDDIAKWACLGDLIKAVNRAIEEGSIDCDDPVLVSLGLWATAHGLVSLLISKPGIPWPPIDRLVDHVLHASAFGFVTARQPER
jgi:AcrR family transcriptional regulator